MFSRTIVKNELQELDTGSVPKLKEAINSVWCQKIPLTMFQNLVESMPRRMQAVIESGGHMTKY